MGLRKGCVSLPVWISRFEMMPFGLTNVASTFQRLSERLFRGHDLVQVYINNVFIGSKSVEEHKNHLIVVRDHIRESGLKIKLKRCVFDASTVEVLEYIVLKHGVEPDQGKTKCILKAHLTQSKKELRSFLIFCPLNQRFVRAFSHKAAIIDELTRMEAEFMWTEDAKNLFYVLQGSMKMSPTLAFPDEKK